MNLCKQNILQKGNNMKPKLSSKPARRVVELAGGRAQGFIRNPNVGDEVAERKMATGSKNVAGSATLLFGLNKILVPIDFSNLSEKLLRHAVQFVNPKTGRIILLHIVGRRKGSERQARFAPTNGDLMDDAEQKLLILGERELGPTVPFDIRVQSGRAYREVVNAAKALSVDLIVMGIRGSTKTHSRAGSTAERVIRHAPCPVLVIRELEHNLFWPLPRHRHPSTFSQPQRMRGG
jgi:nucleotide-binding universal stress UspA family protein